MSITLWLRVAAIVFFMALGAGIAHKFDLGKIEHQKGLVTAEKLGREKDVKDAIIWATEKQQKYDAAAIARAQEQSNEQVHIAAAAQARLRELQSIPPRVLVRGCLSYEFVRQLDAALTNRSASSLSIPAGKSADACAPVDAAAVERWIIGGIATHQANAAQLNGLIGFFRDAQARR